MDLSTAKSHQKGCLNPAVGTSQIRFWNSPWWLQYQYNIPCPRQKKRTSMLLSVGITDAHTVRHFKAVTGSHKRAGLLVHFFAEFVGRNVQIIINQCRSAGFRLYIADVRFAADPIVQNLQILPDDLSAAFLADSQVPNTVVTE